MARQFIAKISDTEPTTTPMSTPAPMATSKPVEMHEVTVVALPSSLLALRFGTARLYVVEL